MRSINELQRQFNEVVDEHQAENDRRSQCQQRGDGEGEQACMDRMTGLGKAAIQIQERIVSKTEGRGAVEWFITRA